MKANTLIFGVLLGLLGAGAGVSAAASEIVQTDPIGVAIGVDIVAGDGTVFARYDLADHSQGGSLRAYLEAERDRN